MKTASSARITIIASLFIISIAGLYAQPSITFSASPSPDGSSTSFNAGYSWSDSLSSRVKFNYTSNNVISELPDIPDSLLAAKEEWIESDISIVRYRPANSSLLLHAGIGYRMQGVLEEGHFVYGSQIQKYKNEYSIHYAGPYLGLEYKLPAIPSLPVSTSVELGCMPVYMFGFNQNISIQPLVSGEGGKRSAEFRDPGGHGRSGYFPLFISGDRSGLSVSEDPL